MLCVRPFQSVDKTQASSTHIEAAKLKPKKERSGRKIDLDPVVQNAYAREWATILPTIGTITLDEFSEQH